MSEFSIPTQMSATIASKVRASGTTMLETGGFTLAPYGTDSGTVLALSGEIGIERSWGLFEVSGLAIAALFDWADDHELRVLSQWHSHRFEAFLSKTDLAHGFNVPGFRTAVIPNFERPSADPTAWGWWRYTEDKWVITPPPVPSDTSFEVITFEEHHVREH